MRAGGSPPAQDGSHAEPMFESLADVNVLVTGGFGFIGSHLVRRLLGHGARVGVITRSTPAGVEASLGARREQLEAYAVDLTDYPKLGSVIDRMKPVKVFHLAGLVNLERSFEVAEACIRNNVQGTLTLLQALRGTGVETFVFASTTEVYGSNPVPFSEDQHADPPSPYAISKLAGEHLCALFRNLEGYGVTILRLSTVYGPGQTPTKLIPSVIRACLAGQDVHITEGLQKRDFVYVDDAVDGLLRASVVEQAIGETINLGHEDAMAVRDVVYRIRGLLALHEAAIYHDLPTRQNEQMHCACLGEKAREILGWEPKTALDKGLGETIAWYAAKFPAGSSEQTSHVRT